MNTLKILVVTNMYPDENYPTRGIFVKEQIDLITRNDESISVDVEDISKGDSRKATSKYLLSSFGLLFKILKNKYDIIHVHYGLTSLPLLFILPILKLSKFKFIITFHGSDILGPNYIVRQIARAAVKFFDLSICVSNEIFLSINTSNKIYLPCGVAPQFFQYDTKKNKFKKRIVFGSSPSRDVKNYPRFKFICELLRIDGYEFDVICLENLNRDEIKNILINSSCLLLTSKHEGSPQVVKESIACNTPVVSVDVGDVSVILDGLDNCVVSNIDKELDVALRRVLTLQKNYDYSVRASEYDGTLIAKKLKSLYFKVIKIDNK